MNGQSRDTGNIEYNAYNQNKNKTEITTQQRKLEWGATRI